MTAEQRTAQAVKMPDNPGTRLPPPILLLAVMFPGYCLQQLWALELAKGSGWPIAGWAVIGVGVLILVVGWVQFFRAETNILHDRPATHVIQSGLYRFSRNPIYVSALLLQLGIAFLMNNLWIVLLLPVSKRVLDKYVIAREEAYLERAFGEIYLDYRRSVRRWL